MVWYYETFTKVGKLRVIDDMVIIEIDGGGTYDIPVSDGIDIISNAVEVPLDPYNLEEGMNSVSVSKRGLTYYIPVDGQMYVAIVCLVIYMIQNPDQNLQSVFRFINFLSISLPKGIWIK